LTVDGLKIFSEFLDVIALTRTDKELYSKIRNFYVFNYCQVYIEKKRMPALRASYGN